MIHWYWYQKCSISASLLLW